MKEEGEKAGKNWVDGEVLHLIALWGGMELEFTKMQRNKVNSNLLKPYNLFICFVFIIET
jgi:hypothetical protein